MVGWHHQLNGHEFEQTLGDSGGQGRLAYFSPWSQKELDTTEQLNNKRVWSRAHNTVDPTLGILAKFSFLSFWLYSFINL